MTPPARIVPRPGGGSQIRGSLRWATAEFTRPANTTAYAVGDVVGESASAESVLTFPVSDTPGGSGFIVKGKITTSQTTNVAEYTLHLFTVPAASLTIPFDNAAWTSLYAERDYYLGKITFEAVVDGAGTSTAAIAQNVALSFPYRTRGPEEDGGDSNKTYNIYGVLVTETAFTPDSAQTFSVELVADNY